MNVCEGVWVRRDGKVVKLVKTLSPYVSFTGHVFPFRSIETNEVYDHTGSYVADLPNLYEGDIVCAASALEQVLYGF